jgi:hypothetical protein
MKYLYNVQILKADGGNWNQGVLAADTTVNSVVTSAAVNAINYGMAQAGAGSVLQNCFKVGQVDHDATV